MIRAEHVTLNGEMGSKSLLETTKSMLTILTALNLVSGVVSMYRQESLRCCL